MGTPARLSVIVQGYYEEDNLTSTMEALHQDLEPCAVAHEAIVVDKGSIDCAQDTERQINTLSELCGQESSSLVARGLPRWGAGASPRSLTPRETALSVASPLHLASVPHAPTAPELNHFFHLITRVNRRRGLDAR